jgi:membrane associated rhomboid family serine protease
LFPIRDLNPTRVTPIVTIGVIAINVLVFFFWQPPAGDPGEESFVYERAAIACELTTGDALSATEITRGTCREVAELAVFPDKNVWLAGLVSMFLHAGIFHLLSNMWFLWIFGNNVEEAYGTVPFLALYVAAGIAATTAFVLANPDSTIPLVGASGAIAGVLGAYLVLFPTHRVLTWFLFLFVPVPAVIFLGIWLLSQFGLPSEGVAWEAHVGGFVAGMLITLPFRGILLRRISETHRPQQIFAQR